MKREKYKDADVWPFTGGDSLASCDTDELENEFRIASAPFLLKPGREVLDPLNRVVTVISKTGDSVKCKLAGPYGATCTYPASSLRPVAE